MSARYGIDWRVVNPLPIIRLAVRLGAFTLESDVNEFGLNPLLLPSNKAESLKTSSMDMPSVALRNRHLCDLELLLNGAFTPLTGFMNRAVYESVLDASRLPGGELWPMPITLDIDQTLAETLSSGMQLALRDEEGLMLACLHIDDLWQPNKSEEAERVYGTTSRSHPGVRYLLDQTGPVYVGGTLQGAQLPIHYNYQELRHSPQELRQLFARLGWQQVVAFHTSRPIHRREQALTMQAAKRANAHILIHPTVGVGMPRDLSYFARMKCYQAALQHYPHGLSALSLLPLALRGAGPREALWHVLVRRNYGCSHMIINDHHASPSVGEHDGQAFYPEYAAQKLVSSHAEELDIVPITMKTLCYSPDRRTFIPRDDAAKENLGCDDIPDAELAKRLAHGQRLPDWFTFPEVLRALEKIYPPRSRQGITLFFTGLSGAGKSTLAKIIYGRFIEEGRRAVTLLDGDIVRRNLSSELGFSKAHRDVNVRRIGFVASEITKNGGVAICAPIAPYAATRAAVRESIEEHGAMVEIHVATPLAVCEERDRKGLYAKARKGMIPEFTGISDPYEAPVDPELCIDTSNSTPVQAAEEIFLYLLREGYLDPSPLPE